MSFFYFGILPLIKHSEHVSIYAARPGHGSEEESRHRVRVHGPQRVQDRAQFAEPARFSPVGRSHVLVKRALRLSPERLDVLPTLQLRRFCRTETDRGETGGRHGLKLRSEMSHVKIDGIKLLK